MKKTKSSTKAEGVTLTLEFGGGSLAGYLTASYKDLKAILGPPNVKGDGYKTSTEWNLMFQGCVFTLYDYKDTSLYDRDLPSPAAFRRLPSFDWHIGASRGSVNEFRAAILGAIAKLHGEQEAA